MPRHPGKQDQTEQPLPLLPRSQDGGQTLAEERLGHLDLALHGQRPALPAGAKPSWICIALHRHKTLLISASHGPLSHLKQL